MERIMRTKVELTAPCGLDCFNCLVYEENINPQIAGMFSAQLGIPADKIACKGCREQPGCSISPEGFVCKTLECTNEKGLNYCFECDEFPCSYLQPAVEGADKFPHNYKLFNLCRMQKVGVEKWAEEESLQIREKYFKGQFIPGTGPVLS